MKTNCCSTPVRGSRLKPAIAPIRRRLLLARLAVLALARRHMRSSQAAALASSLAAVMDELKTQARSWQTRTTSCPAASPRIGTRFSIPEAARDGSAEIARRRRRDRSGDAAQSCARSARQPPSDKPSEGPRDCRRFNRIDSRYGRIAARDRQPARWRGRAAGAGSRARRGKLERARSRSSAVRPQPAPAAHRCPAPGREGLERRARRFAGTRCCARLCGLLRPPTHGA